MNLALEIAKQTMMNAQTAIGVATNNLANQTVDGYTRQNVNLTTSISIQSGKHLVGTGASISSIDRIRTGFYDKQYRDNLGIYKNADTLVTGFSRIETFLGSLDGDTGLKTSFNSFFNSLEELSKNPEKSGIKQVVRDNANNVVQSFNLISNNLKTMKEQYQSYTESKVSNINKTLENLRIVNDEIGRLSAMGQNPNDLLDERDRLIDSLSADMDISVVPAKNNKVNVVSNGHVLVQDSYASLLSFGINVDGSISIKYEDGMDFKSNGGELSALKQLVNETIPEYNDKVDLLAKDFIDSFNAMHRTGVASDGTTNIDFFEGDNAGNIKVSEQIDKNPSLIMNSTDGLAGNNDLVLGLIGLKDSPVIGGEFGIVEFYDNVASSISTDTKAMKVKSDNYKYIKDEIYVMRSNETGVNEDEELLTTVKLQQTYAAASKIISTLNSMFDSLISAV